MAYDPTLINALTPFFQRRGTPLDVSAIPNNSISRPKMAFPIPTVEEVAAAVTAANTAQTSATAAVTTANAAVTTANAAQTTANTAQQDVDTLSDLVTLREQYVMFRDNKGASQGGTFPALTWVTRDLNEVQTMTPPEWASLNAATGVITLRAGTYQISASAPAFRVDDHKAVLARVFDGMVLVAGTKEFASSSDPGRGQTRSFITGRFTLPFVMGVHIRHYAQTEKTGNGLGKGPDAPADFGANIFTTVEIWRVS